MNATIFLHVPDLAPAEKHPTIFRKFDGLQPGESLMLVNDHDPIPLFYELGAERPGTFEWEKVENGPERWIVKIHRTGGACSIPAPTVAGAALSAPPAEQVLVVPELEPRRKHPTIFEWFDALQPGEAFQILNDHDPKPLYYQLIGERGNIFSWTYLEKGPIRWRVRIGRNAAETGATVGAIAAADIRKAEVFRKYGIDFCCGGKKSVQQACAEAGVDAEAVQAELQAVGNEAVRPAQDFNRWQPDFLADYIYNQHHTYYYEQGPVIADLLDKVVDRHGSHYPVLQRLAQLYGQLQAELAAHFGKEERVLFPFIRSLCRKEGDPADITSFPSMEEPVHMMEADHEAAGELLAEMNALTDGYTPPADACNSFQFLYRKLKELEQDLHQHVHLENNILFPKALRLEKERRAALL